MDLIYLEVFKECVIFARGVFSWYASKLSHVSQDDLSTNIDSKQLASPEKVINESRFVEIITESNIRLDKLLDKYSQILIEQMQRQRVQDAVQEVQARVSALKILLNHKSVDRNLISQLLITSLNPLQVSLEITRLRLGDIENSKGYEVWTFCNAIGMSALITGYKFLGQEVPFLEEELKKEIKMIQKRVLDEVAVIAPRGAIPWDNIPHLISMEGIDDLVTLYKTLKENNLQEGMTKTNEEKVQKQPKFFTMREDLTKDNLKP